MRPPSPTTKLSALGGSRPRSGPVTQSNLAFPPISPTSSTFRSATGSRNCPNRNLLAHAPKHLHDELTEDYRDMIYADTAAEIETRRKAFLRTAPEVPCGGRQPRESRRSPLHLHPPRSGAMEIGSNHECHRAPERGVPPPDQDPDCAALRRDRADAVLGAAGLRSDPDAEGRRVAHPVSTPRTDAP